MTSESPPTFSEIVARAEQYLKGKGYGLTIRSADTVLFDPLGHYQNIEIRGFLDSNDEVTITVSLGELGGFHSDKLSIFWARLQASEQEREVTIPLREVEKQESEKKDSFARGNRPGKATVAQINHLKALGIKKMHSLSDSELEEMSSENAQTLIETCTKALRRRDSNPNGRTD